MRLNIDVREAAKIDEKDLENVETFTYLGGIITTKEELLRTLTTDLKKSNHILEGSGKSGARKSFPFKLKEDYLTSWSCQSYYMAVKHKKKNREGQEKD